MIRILLLFLLGCTPLCAANIGVSITPDLQSSSNLFLLPADIRSKQPHDGADSILTTALQSIATTNLGDVGVTGTVAAQRMQFAHNKRLNNTGLNAGLNATLTQSQTSLVANASISRQLVSFQEIRAIDRAIQRQAMFALTATHAVLGNVRLIAGTDFIRSTNGNPIIALNDYDRAGYRAGIGYYSPTGNILALEYHGLRSKGLNDRPAVLGGRTVIYRADYREDALQLHLFYAPSALVQVDLRTGKATHRDRSGVGGNFAGLTGQATVNWSPRPTIRANLYASRDYQSSGAVLSNGVRVSRIGAMASGDVSARWTIEVTGQRDWRQFRYDLESGSLSGPRNDQSRSVRATARYAATDRLTFSLDASAGRRSSSDALFRYTERRVGGSIRFAFGRSSASGV